MIDQLVTFFLFSSYANRRRFSAQLTMSNTTRCSPNWLLRLLQSSLDQWASGGCWDQELGLGEWPGVRSIGRFWRLKRQIEIPDSFHSMTKIPPPFSLKACPKEDSDGSEIPHPAFPKNNKKREERSWFNSVLDSSRRKKRVFDDAKVLVD